jgi:hypothetical protein
VNRSSKGRDCNVPGHTHVHSRMEDLLPSPPDDDYLQPSRATFDVKYDDSQGGALALRLGRSNGGITQSRDKLIK